jgi:RNase P subunit RPR2
MIDLGTLAGLLEHRNELAAYCPRCDRWPQLNRSATVDAGLGDHWLPIKVRCKSCGEPGRLQVRPPVPTRSTSVGWVELPSG